MKKVNIGNQINHLMIPINPFKDSLFLKNIDQLKKHDADNIGHKSKRTFILI